MAQQLDDGEFWLPSEFLTDDDLLRDFKADNTFTTKFGFNSDLSSPVESIMGSTETESDDEEFMNSYIKLAQTYSSEFTAKGVKLSGSPQSTLCGCKLGSGRVSLDSRVSLPTDAKGAAGWEFLCEVARMSMIEETAQFYSPAPKPNPVNFQLKNPNTAPTGFYPIQPQVHRPYQHLQFQKMGNNGIWSQYQNRTSNGGNPVLSSAVWPTLQQSSQNQPQPGSAMRPIPVQKERTGTGVFLPRRYTGTGTGNGAGNGNGPNPVDSRSKRPVHLQEKVSRGNGNFTPNYDLLVAKAKNAKAKQSNEQALMNNNPELRLPQEWTY